MSDSSRIAEERAYFLTEQTWHLVEERRARAFSERQRALLSFPPPTPGGIADIYARYAQTWLAAYAAPALTHICHLWQLNLFLQRLDEDRRWLLDVQLPEMATFVLTVSNQDFANGCAVRFRMLIDLEFEEWKAKGHRNVFEFGRHAQGAALTPQSTSSVPQSPSQDQAELNELRQQLAENYRSRIVVPLVSPDDSPPDSSSEPGERPVIEGIGSDSQLPGRHGNRALLESARRTHEMANGEKLTNKKVSERAGYASRTDLKAWSKGKARTKKADTEIRKALKSVILDAQQALEAEKARRKQQTEKIF
jgi:hypothetical protein